jgi:hypothetical protein
MQMTAKLSTHRASSRRTPSATVKASPLPAKRLSHEEEMAVLRRQAAQINSSPENAMAFLIRAGLVTPSGRWRQLIRD